MSNLLSESCRGVTKLHLSRSRWGVQGEPAVYDPCAFYGHAEADFGMSWCADFTDEFWQGRAGQKSVLSLLSNKRIGEKKCQVCPLCTKNAPASFYPSLLMKAWSNHNLQGVGLYSNTEFCDWFGGVPKFCSKIVSPVVRISFSSTQPRSIDLARLQRDDSWSTAFPEETMFVPSVSQDDPLVALKNCKQPSRFPSNGIRTSSISSAGWFHTQICTSLSLFLNLFCIYVKIQEEYRSLALPTQQDQVSVGA